MVSVGLNSEITNFELLWTIEAELQTLSNLGLPTKMELQTHPNPPKIQNSEPANWIWPNTNKHHLMIAVHDQISVFSVRYQTEFLEQNWTLFYLSQRENLSIFMPESFWPKKK